MNSDQIVISATRKECAGEETDLPADMGDRYDRAQFMWQLMMGQKKASWNTTVYPHWIGNSDNFWYKRETKHGIEYRLVNAINKSNHLAFQHKILASTLSKASGETVDSSNLPLENEQISLNPLKVNFVAYDQYWQYDEASRSCVPLARYHGDWIVSPDGSKAVFSRDYNLWLVNLINGQECALTNDGSRHYAYATTASTYGRQEFLTLETLWSPDSRQLFTHVRDTRQVKAGPPLIQYVPTDGTFRPKDIGDNRHVGFSQDKHAETYQFLAIDVTSGQLTKANLRPSLTLWPPYVGFFTAQNGWWGQDSRRAYFTDISHDDHTGRLIEFDTHTGLTKVLIEDTNEGYFSFVPYSHLRPLLTVLPETDELIWYSVRNGWPHLYLYDLNSGNLKHQITEGDWSVRNIIHVDLSRRELLIQTAERIKGKNPYYCDICRVNIDNGEITTLLSTDHEYVVLDGRSRVSSFDAKSRGASCTGNYIVTTRSRADELPVSLLLDRQGEPLMELEQATLSGMPKDWSLPEPVMLKGADDETDIYAVIFRPSNFSADNSYPVVDITYPGLTTPAGSFSNATGGGVGMYIGASIAELGFIAVSMETRGGVLRNETFMTYQDPKIPIGNFDYYNHLDQIAGLKQMATRYPYMDLNRVGVCTIGTVPSALTGLMAYPDFFKVGVSVNALSDMRLFGMFAGFSGRRNLKGNIEELFDGLQGKLLIMHGMLDDVVPVAVPLRLAETLFKAGKPIDMLLLPNEGHTMSAQAMTYAWDYMVKHLMGVTPPRERKDSYQR
ncbi:S9 family peptidase [Oceanicoccus sagamiensis]|uniref:Peptidase S9 prolyl oligopeptidase catalytic domain-containing protein n=1 Tax=Oceanicoccus sagamiensis TaxID=716816 RepID=A0A1X9N6U3_9GAMM|nr:DPP IV N-terminal domain-containing protein [Oceanicoccus sagamiensis]ARN73820.1 hypothetical protein BST96_06650 [Oceanicoccus sagamiensis]